MLPERPKPDSVPPVTVTSARVKFVEASDNMNVICADSPGCKLVRDEVTDTVGGVVFNKPILTELLASLPSALALADASVKAPLATLTVPVPVAPLVKVAE